jgi:hypothetical protein
MPKTANKKKRKKNNRFREDHPHKAQRVVRAGEISSNEHGDPTSGRVTGPKRPMTKGERIENRTRA